MLTWHQWAAPSHWDRALHIYAHSSLTLCNTMDCDPLGSSVRGDSPVKNIEVGCHFLLQRGLPNAGIEPVSPALRRVLYH